MSIYVRGSVSYINITILYTIFHLCSGLLRDSSVVISPEYSLELEQTKRLYSLTVELDKEHLRT